MNETPRVLSDEQIIEIKKSAKASDPSKPWGDTLALSRAIESATLKAVRGQEPFARVYSFNDLGGQYDLLSPPTYRPPVGALLYALPPAQPAPAPVDEREAFEVWWSAEGVGTDSPYDIAFSAWQARAALQCAQAPQPTKGQP